MKLQRCWSLTRYPVAGTWYRAIPAKYATTPLAHAHTATRSGRFHHGTPHQPGISVVYLTEDPQTALYEVRALLGSPLPGQARAPNPNPNAWTILPVAVALSSVADLTRDPELALLDTSVQELTGEWLGYGLRSQHQNAPPPFFTHVPTQQLGLSLHGTGLFEGLLTYSAVDPLRRNLVLFPAPMAKGSRVTCDDPSGKTHQLSPARRGQRKR